MNRVLSTKHLDTKTKLLGNSISFEILAGTDRPYIINIMNHEIHHKMFYEFARKMICWLLPLFFYSIVVRWCFYSSFWNPLVFFLKKSGIYLWNFPCTRNVFNFLLKFYRSLTIKFRRHENITILGSTAHGGLNLGTSAVVTELYNHDKKTSKTFH